MTEPKKKIKNLFISFKMRLTQQLRAQHLGFMFKKHWQIQGKRVPNDTGAEAALTAKGIKVVDAKEFAFTKPKVDLYEKH